MLAGFERDSSDHECFHELIYVLCPMCFLPFVVRIPIPPRPTFDNNINSDSQLFIVPFLVISRAA